MHARRRPMALEQLNRTCALALVRIRAAVTMSERPTGTTRVEAPWARTLAGSVPLQMRRIPGFQRSFRYAPAGGQKPPTSPRVRGEGQAVVAETGGALDRIGAAVPPCLIKSAAAAVIVVYR